MNEVYYEPHPVTPERKAELRAKGYRIVDAKYKPKGYKNPGESKPKAKAVKDDNTIRDSS